MADNIQSWLDRLGLSEHEAVFEENKIDLDILPELEEGDLKEMGIPLGHRKKISARVA